MANNNIRIAYFSMEISLQSGMPTYAGGLGILAGDTLRSAADMNIPMVGVSLLPRRGYFRQQLGHDGWQQEAHVDWIIEDYLEEIESRTSVNIEGRTVIIRAWKYCLSGGGGDKVFVYFLDTNLPENSAFDRSLADFLYGGDSHYRLCQEVVLGIGGVRMLKVLGYNQLQRFHLNEGHASLLILELLEQKRKLDGDAQVEQMVRDLCAPVGGTLANEFRN